MRRQARATRVARGAVAASVATFVALLSHVTAGGAIPGLLGIAVPLALSFVVCTVLAGRRLSAVRLTAAVAASQVLFHTLFVLGSYDAMSGHVHGSSVLVVSDAAAPLLPTEATMLLWHAAAAAATTLALHRGERTLAVLRTLAHRALAWVRARARVVAAATGPVPARRTFADVVAEVRPSSLLLADSARRRGPPSRALTSAPLLAT